VKILCVFGKYQYGDPKLGLGTEYAAFFPALKNLGHEVVHFDSWQRDYYANYAELNQALLATVEKEKPDVMLTVQRLYEIWLETLTKISLRGDVATISWTTDDSWKYREVSRFIGPAYHAMTTSYPETIAQYHADGIPNVLLTQWAASSDTLQKPIPASTCQYKVSFVGAAHGNRKQLIAELVQHGIEVSCFGSGWPAGPVPAQEIPRIMRESFISLNFANASKGKNQIKARTFEVPGAGGFLLTEYAPELEKYYNLDTEIVVFHNMAELGEKIKYFLANPQERDAIAMAGFERTQRDHTYEMRMQEVLDFALNSRYNWLESNAKPETLDFEKATEGHQLNLFLKALRQGVLAPSIIIWGNERGQRAARRLMYELSWRIFGEKTFTAAGWPGRMFPFK
jgi:spore maturation protein CgeB